MKLKSFIGASIACAAIAVMAVSAHAEQYAIGGSSGHVDGSEHTGNTVDVPVMVIPDANETAVVNGYVMTFTYDPKEATPVANGDANSPYAKEGSAFTDGIIVSGIQSAANGKQTLIIAWASATPVQVKASEGTAKETMAEVTFTVKDEAATSVPVDVAMTQLVDEDNSTVKTNEEGGGITNDMVVETGQIDLADFIYGDVDGNGALQINDISLARRNLVGLITLDSDQIARGNVDTTEGISINDVSLMSRKLVGLIAKFPIES